MVCSYHRVCTQRMGDNEMRRPRAMGGGEGAHTKLVPTLCELCQVFC